MIGKIHSFESFGTVDGPGIRFVIFMQGCKFRCLYCHNPDTFDLGAASFMLSPEQVFGKMEKFKVFYKKGGVTISGGEPLLQPTFIKEFFKLCKAERIHTAIDTGGGCLTDEVKAALTYTDMVLLDVKCIDPDIHKSLTGQPLQPTLDFAEYLSEQGISVWIRYVLVPGITDRDDLIEKHADYVSSLKNVEKVEILPFHKLALSKYEKLGIEYALKDTEPPTAERIENAKNIYKNRGIKVN
ncbi:pyruvate formate-lyase 1-activating enzyme [Anaeromicrobium sediminis]|uniref:Pyruvate formate-lyase-activating enzyme n=1 Tax=Anaeromicrobium sediminis TaxID=1478221 RepID=A0A267MEV1_9FIRM|nr:pyruvate formate-lyase 1-activating enzyme [Anaeromicrobium sediminis]